MAGGFKTPVPFMAFSWGAGTIVPVNPTPVFPVTSTALASQLNIRGETNRLRSTERAESATVIRENLPKMFEAIQSNADQTTGILRKLLNAFPFVAQDASGNVVLTGATFTVRAGNQTFKLANGVMLWGVSTIVPNDGDIPNGQVTTYLDEIGDQLIFRVRYSDGTLRTGTIALV